MRASETIITIRRFQRSTRAPTNGPIKILGNMKRREPAASIVAEPVVLVIHQIRAKETILLPN
jgi:hypothetical protein